MDASEHVTRLSGFTASTEQLAVTMTCAWPQVGHMRLVCHSVLTEFLYAMFDLTEDYVENLRMRTDTFNFIHEANNLLTGQGLVLEMLVVSLSMVRRLWTQQLPLPSRMQVPDLCY